MKKKIAVIGAGLFGISTSLILSKKFDVTLFEKNKKILLGASKKNQLRFHLGYHYPRSKKTLNEIKQFSKKFIKFYGKNIYGVTKNFYGVANKESKITFNQYINFIKKNKLFFKKHNGQFFNDENIEGTIISNEKNLNYFKIYKKILFYLKNSSINLKLNTKFNKKLETEFDKIIVACYEQNNSIIKDLGYAPKKKYKYELVEKILIKLPKQFSNKSFMVLDGKFVSLDPFLGTKYHLLSDVKNSKLEVTKKVFPNFKNKNRKFLNKGIVKNIKVSKFNKFISRSSKYLPFLKTAVYVGSFFVIRSIEINKEKTDERTNNITRYGKKIYSIHSGKWNTSIGLANVLYKKIK